MTFAPRSRCGIPINLRSVRQLNPSVAFVSAALSILYKGHTPAPQSCIDRGAGLKLPSGSFLCRPMSGTDSTAPDCNSSLWHFHSPLLKPVPEAELKKP